MMAEEVNSYEEQRRRQMEKNRQKLEELSLHHLSAAARPKPKPKPKPKLKREAPAPGELRRSGRVAGLPEQPNYHRGVYEAYAVRKGPTDEERAGAIAKAEELSNRLKCSSQPAFFKRITQPYVTSKIYMMTIPNNFIKYLLAHDEVVVVVDEVGDEFHMMYNAKKSRKHYCLDKGWRGFGVHHDLDDGDCFVFQLTERTKFKVYIFRASPDYESDQTSDDYEDED